MRDQLNAFFQANVGSSHASQVLRHDFPHYLPLMKKHPDIVAAGLQQFRGYLEGPLDNVPATFRMLRLIAEQIPELRDEIVQQLGASLAAHKEMLPTHSAAGELVALLEVLNLPVSPEDAVLTDLARAVVVLRQRFLLVIGAGFSYDSMPITNELAPLLVPFLREHGVTNPVAMIRDADKQVWQVVRENPREFAERFSGWTARATPTLQHNVVAQMLHSRHLMHVISFNWDDLIERAGEASGIPVHVVNCDGVTPTQPSLWKLHGDVRKLKGSWVFPYDEGQVFRALVESLDATTRSEGPPAFALIVGYSESEIVVRDELISWIEENVPRVLRVRPTWEGGQGGMARAAGDFFRALTTHVSLQEARVSAA